MTPDVLPAIAVHQCLFGYEDGHRLLAASFPVPPEVLATLLPLSDLASGIELGPREGYWTGIPLPSARQYALMRTWAAPEMSRPGCVWTHALVIGFPDMAHLGDLRALWQHMARPQLVGHYDGYTRPLRVAEMSAGNSDGAWTPGATASDTASTGRLGKDASEAAPLGDVAVPELLALVRAVYGAPGTGVMRRTPGARDDAVFALWSQQWPRLRRVFAFRTAGRVADAVSGRPFDLRLVTDRDASRPAKSPDRVAAEGSMQPWEVAAVDDLRATRPTTFRQFLWRYGADLRLRGGLHRYRSLADLYTASRTSPLTGPALEALLADVAHAIPDPADGATLKRDVVGGRHARYSLFPPTDPLDTLAFFVRQPNLTAPSGAFPEALDALRAHAVPALAEDLATRPDAVGDLAEWAVEHPSALGEAVLDRVAAAVHLDRFRVLTRGRAGVRRALVGRNPTLLLGLPLAEVPPPELRDLLASLPETSLPEVGVADPAFATRLLEYLVHVDDADVARAMDRRFPRETIAVAAAALRRQVEEGGPSLPATWAVCLAARPDELLEELRRSGAIASARTTRWLARLAQLVGYDRPIVLAVGPAPWIDGVVNARDDVRGPERDVFLAFLLVVALHRPVRGVEGLFERAFAPVHEALAQDRVAPDARRLLARHLPAQAWWDEWDVCSRLRAAVAAAYVAGDLDPRSLLRLAGESGKLRRRLVREAESTVRGAAYIKTARA